LAAAAALFTLGGMAAITLRHLGRSLPAWPGLTSLLHARIVSVQVVGAPAELASPIDDFLHGRPAAGSDLASRVAALPERFPCVKSVRLQRDWFRHSARVELSLRRAVGRVVRERRPDEFLDEDGGIFAAPAQLYPDARLEVEPGSAAAAQLQALAAMADTWARAELPSPARSVSYRSGTEGWELVLEDGTRVLWGDMQWPAEKLARLGEALADARTRFPGGLVADLRYFEDGRVLLRPYAAERQILKEVMPWRNRM
jgi:hypothetical protein